MEEIDYKLGNLEFAFKLTNNKTGEETLVVSTPAMWAIANDYQDKLLAKGDHTHGWVIAKYINVLVMMAAAKAGLINKSKGIPSLNAQADFINDFSFEDVSHLYKASKGDEEENPTQGDQEGDQEVQ